jgi:hypothetical protein
MGYTPTNSFWSTVSRHSSPRWSADGLCTGTVSRGRSRPQPAVSVMLTMKGAEFRMPLPEKSIGTPEDAEA